MKTYDVVIIGAGIMGCAVARELARWQASVCVVDAGADVASQTTRANSGIVHAGFDAKHGTLKAKYNVAGSLLYPKLAEELGFRMRNNGSVVLAYTPEECESLQHLLENGQANGVEGLRIVDAEELRQLEPNVSPDAVAALVAPTGAITDPYDTTYALADNAAANGVEFSFDVRVEVIKRAEVGFVLTVQNLLTQEAATLQARVVVNAAGVQADAVAALAGCAVPAITARRGEYCVLDKKVGTAFDHTMFRAPSKVGKGVLVSPTIDGNLIVGPNAWPVDRTNRATTKEGITEITTKAHDIWPALDEGAVIARFAGLRATPANGDFTIGWAEEVPGFYNCSGIESPGLTAAPAIAVDVAPAVAEYLGAEPNAAFNPRREAEPRYMLMTDKQRADAIAKDPAWGRMVCRCEKVTEAEIRAAVNARIPARTLDAIKWRTRAGMGRCHGGFCSPIVTRIIAEDAGLRLDEVRKDGAGTRVAAEAGCIKDGPLNTTAATPSPCQPQATYDLVVVGGGAGGIASALAAKRAGVNSIVILERDDALGGILKQCIHPGFGLDRYNEELTGPEYAWRDEQDLHVAGIEYHTSTTVTDLIPQDDGTYRVFACGVEGTFDLRAKSVILACGSRERSAGQVDLQGTRPAGVYTAGCAQFFTNLMGTLPGKRVVIYGSGDIGLIMARRLHWEGAEVVAVVERAKRPKGLRRNVKQCLEDNNIPLLLNQSVVSVYGNERVEGVEVVHTERETKKPIPGTEYRIDCDTLLLSCGLIPDQGLLESAGGEHTAWGSVHTTLPGVYLCGNASQIHDIVDNVTVGGDYVGACAAAYILGQAEPEAPQLQEEGAAAAATAEVFDNLPAGAESITCICCPKGCQMVVRPLEDIDPGTLDDRMRKLHVIEGWYVEGNVCKRGLTYAHEEKTAPQRTLTSLVRAANRLEPVSVRTSRPIAKSDIPFVLQVLQDVCVRPPLAVGDVIVEDVAGTGANIIATKPLD